MGVQAMLYQAHEYFRSMLNPWSELSGIVSKSLHNPSSQYSFLPYSERMAALLQLVYRIGKDYEKPVWKIKPLNIEGQIVPVLPEVIVSKPFCNLLHFKDTAMI